MKAAVAAAAVVALGMVVLELVMEPSGGERWEPLLLFAAMAAVTIAAVYAVPRTAVRARSFGAMVAAVGVVAAGLIALAVWIGAWRMFLSVHDLHLLGVVLAVAAGLSVVFAVSVTRSLRRDLAALRRTASRVSGGDLGARTGVARADELGAAATAMDAMIEQLALAEALRRQDDDARRALLAAIGHDLRTPLAALQATIEALEDGLAGDPDRYLKSMGHDVAHLRSLVDDLFLLARIEAGELALNREHVDLSELADEAVEAMQPIAARHHVDLVLEADGRILVLGGPQALARVLRNLVDNAIRHAPESTTVVVRVRNGDCATVEVLDDGPGFDPTVLGVAFESFTRADPSRNRDTGGAGLGLAIAKGVVEAHGGRIWAAEGPGGRVGFEIPVDATRHPPSFERRGIHP